MLYTWRLSGYSEPIHSLVHGHMTSNNETVYRQISAKCHERATLRKLLRTREMLTAVHVIRASS